METRNAYLFFIVAFFVIITTLTIRTTKADDVPVGGQVSNATPTVSTIRMGTAAYGNEAFAAGIIPEIGTTKSLHLNGVVSDGNGDATINSVSAIFYRTSKGSSCAPDKNDCYKVASCAIAPAYGNATEAAYSCPINLDYFADATDVASQYPGDTWTAYVSVTDVATTTATLSATYEVNTLIGVNIPSTINFGTLARGSTTTASTSKLMSFVQKGNRKADVEVSGTDMNCSGAGSIPVANQRWSLTNGAYTSAIPLSSTAARVSLGIEPRTSDATELTASMYWHIAIPASGVGGTCTGSNTVSVLASPLASQWIATEVQTIAASYPMGWESFVIGSDTYLAVANYYNGNYNLDSVIYKWSGSQFVSIQSIPTNGAYDWESFTIGSDTYLAVANSGNGVTSNINSTIYKWNGSQFTSVQSIATNGALDLESFTIGSDIYLAVANSYNDSTYNLNSVIYKWNGSQFTSFQSILTNGAYDWESFTIGSDTYLAIANSNGTMDSTVYKWNGSQFVQFQAIQTNFAYDWESFTIGTDTYLVVANLRSSSSYNTNSTVYKWNGSQFTSIQSIPTSGAQDWDSFTIGSDTYLAVANYYDGVTTDTNSIIYKWNGSQFAQIQSIATNAVRDLKSFAIGSDMYIAVANYGVNKSKIYKFTPLSNASIASNNMWRVTTGSVNENSWASVGTMPFGLSGTTLAVIGDYIYQFGANTGSSYTNGVYRAPVSNPTSWSTVGSLPIAMAYSKLAIIGDYVYLYSGFNSSGYVNSTFRAPISDPTAWVNLSTPVAGSGYAYGSAIIVLGDYVYRFGGYSNEIWRAPTSNPTSWVNTGKTLPNTTTFPEWAVIGDYIYLFGGGGTADINQKSNTIYRASVSDPTTWTNTGKTLPTNLGNGQVILTRDYVYYIGGMTSNVGYTHATYRAPVTDPTLWSQTAYYLPNLLAWSQAAVVGDSVYLFGGVGSGGAVTSAVYKATVNTLLAFNDVQQGGKSLEYSDNQQNLATALTSRFPIFDKITAFILDIFR